jgi:hypothetical protein
MTTAKTLDDYIAEFNSALQALPDDPGASFIYHFAATIRVAFEDGFEATELVDELEDDIDCWNTEGHCAAYDNYDTSGIDDLRNHFTAWMAVRTDDLQDDGTALLDIGVTAVEERNVHGPGCYVTAAQNELASILRDLGAEHVSPDLDDIIAFIPSEVISELPTWPEQIREESGWTISSTGDLFGDADDSTNPDFINRANEKHRQWLADREAKTAAARARAATETPAERTARLLTLAGKFDRIIDTDALDKLAAQGPATTVPPFVELGRSPSPSEYCALQRLLLEDHAMEDFYFTPVDALLADFHRGVDPHVSFNELAKLWS